MMDIVIPLSDTSKWYDIELKYALRSIEQYIDVWNVFIVGLCPSWLTGVIHIPYTDIPNLRQKEKNIVGKVLAACHDERVSNDFIFANDDHFLLEPWMGLHEHGGPLVPNYPNAYNQTVKNTIDLIGQWNNFDIHCPVTFNKRQYIRIFEGLDIPDFGYCMKTVYCAKSFGSNFGVYCDDLKLNSAFNMVQLDSILSSRRWFSMSDIAFDGDLRQWLQKRFKIRSKWEKEKELINQNY